MAQHGPDEVLAYAAHLRAYSERLTRASIATWPDGTYQFEDHLVLDDRTPTERIPIRVVKRRLRVRDLVTIETVEDASLTKK